MLCFSFADCIENFFFATKTRSFNIHTHMSIGRDNCHACCTTRLRMLCDSPLPSEYTEKGIQKQFFSNASDWPGLKRHLSKCPCDYFETCYNPACLYMHSSGHKICPQANRCPNLYQNGLFQGSCCDGVHPPECQYVRLRKCSEESIPSCACKEYCKFSHPANWMVAMTNFDVNLIPSHRMHRGRGNGPHGITLRFTHPNED